MALSVDSKIKDIVANPTAAEAVEKFVPGFSTNKQMKMCYGITLRAFQKFPQAGLSLEALAEIDKQLTAIG